MFWNYVVVAGLIMFFVGVCLYAWSHPLTPEDQAHVDEQLPIW